METTTSNFRKVSKKYSLNNSYFKSAQYGSPSTPFEVMKYLQEHGDLPFQYSGNNWMYDCYTEYQKRRKVFGQQFFTPDQTAERIAEIANDYFDKDYYVLDACAGFGQLSKPLLNLGFDVSGFDYNYELSEMYYHNAGRTCIHEDFREFNPLTKYESVVSNPPYDIKDLTDFLVKMHADWLEDNGLALLLIPSGFLQKERPKVLTEIRSKYELLYVEDMHEDFKLTKVKAEIVLLQRI